MAAVFSALSEDSFNDESHYLTYLQTFASRFSVPSEGAPFL